MDILKKFLESSTIHGLGYISSAKVGKRFMLSELLDHSLALGDTLND